MGFEPTRHKPLVPETSVSTIPPPEHLKQVYFTSIFSSLSIEGIKKGIKGMCFIKNKNNTNHYYPYY